MASAKWKTGMTRMAKQPATETRRRWMRRLFGLGVLGGLALLGAELFTRFYLGLGTPPLSVTDETVEYRFKPEQDIYRFGNRVRYNAWSMRSDDFLRYKADPGEFRVLVMGDSVINGGNQTDQVELATELLGTRLREAMGRPVVVGNVSAGSWGPANLLAYIQKFGLFDADMAVLVLSSHDLVDLPTFEPTVGVHPDFPAQEPWLALEEGVTRYLPRYLPWGEGVVEAGDPMGDATDPLAVAEGRAKLAELVEVIEAAGVPVVAVQHLTREELVAEPEPGHAAIAAVLAEAGVRTLQLGPALSVSLGTGDNPYRDRIHLNATGQRVLAEVLEEAVESLLDGTDPGIHHRNTEVRRDAKDEG